MNFTPSGSTAVMARRVDPLDALDDFPTPPAGTRALYQYVLPWLGYGGLAVSTMHAWEGCAGRCIMSEVMQEFHRPPVFASDVHDYGYGAAVGSFVGVGADRIERPRSMQLFATNPPFKLAIEVAERALAETADDGIVALLLRSNWLESEERYRLFRRSPMTVFAPFAARLPMIKGRWDPWASTATSYAWFIWVKGRPAPFPPTFLIPPDFRRHCERPDDIERFGHRGYELELLFIMAYVHTRDVAFLFLLLRITPAKTKGVPHGNVSETRRRRGGAAPA